MPHEASIEPSSELAIADPPLVTVQRWFLRRSVRWKLFLLFLLVTVLALLIRSRGVFLVWEIVIGFNVLFVLWPFVHGTYRLYTRHVISLRADYQSTDAIPLDRFAESHVAALEELGFTFVGCVTQDRRFRGVTTDVALFTHKDNEDTAHLAQIRNSLESVGVLVFSTKFDDGLNLETSNARGRRLFKSDPQFPVFRFPQIRNAPDLYRLHQMIKQEFLTSRIPVNIAASEKTKVFIADAEEAHRRNLCQGDYKVGRSAERFVYTLGGAIRQTFLRTWPVGAIRDMLAEQEAQRKARQLGFQINRKLGALVPLN